MAMKHTPGPWSVFPNCGGGLNIAVKHLTQDRFVDIATTHAVRSPLYLKGREPIEEAEACANGLLMASAPDLFRVVNAWVRYLDDDGVGSHDLEDSILRDMRAAIRKAEGGQP